MKKFILSIVSACAVLSGCQVEEISEPLSASDELFAIIDDTASTKTVMDSYNNILWSEGDLIAAFVRTSLGQKYMLKDSYVGKTSGAFSKVLSEESGDLVSGMELDHIVAYYPYSGAVGCVRSGESYSLNVVLPAEQTYSVESFGEGSWPMVAVSSSSNLTFRNVCGGIKLQFKGNQKVTSIKLQGKNNEKLSGAAVVTAYADDSTPVIEMLQTASTSVTLDCGEGVQLNETEATEFIIALPPMLFSKGFTVTVSGLDNEQTIESSNENKVLRSSLLVMPEVTLELLPVNPENPEPQLGDYVDEDGVNHGPGVEIDGVVWAPVNCGYHAKYYKYGKLYQWGRRHGQGYSGKLYDIDGSVISEEYSDALKPSISIGSTYVYYAEQNPNTLYVGAGYHAAAFQGGNTYYFGNDSNNDKLWNSGSGASPVKSDYDPCPEGWRVPTYAELQGLIQNHSSAVATDNDQIGCYFSGKNAYADGCRSLFLSASGRNSGYDGKSENRGLRGYYWSSDAGETARACAVNFKDGAVNQSNSASRADGYSVRCVRDSAEGTENVELYPLKLTYETTTSDQTIKLAFEDSQSLVAGQGNELISIDYGDGTTGIDLSHTYSESGTYQVQMNFKSPVTEIGYYAFYECSNLIGVEFPENLTKIGESAFERSGLCDSLIIPDNNVSIGTWAFAITGEFENFVIPYGTDFVGGTGQFVGIKAKNFYLGADILDDGDMWKSSSMFMEASIDRLIVGKQVKTLGNYALGHRSGTCIKNIEFESPSVLEYIGDAAFVNNTGIVSITLPSSIKYISTYCPFDLCPGLKEINILENYGTFYSTDGVLYSNHLEGVDCSIFRYPEGKEGASFENHRVSHIAPSAFRDNKYLQKVSVDLGHGIGDCAFMGCTNLSEIYGCDYPMMAELYAYEIYIGKAAFRDCVSLTEYTIGATVDVIKASAFHNCRSLQRIYCKPLVPPVLEDSDDFPTFGNNAPDRVIYVPYASIDAYRAAPVWNTYSDILVPYDFELGEVYDEGLYVDEYGVNHGQGVEIDGVVWAPVNCGYHETDFPYGKLYQWGRKYGQGYDSDTLVPNLSEGTVSLEVGQHPDNSNTYYATPAGRADFDWLYPHDDKLWNSGAEDSPVKTKYDPCPDGWRVPTRTEFDALIGNCTGSYNSGILEGYWFSGSGRGDKIFLPVVGSRDCYTGNCSEPSGGSYWSSTTYKNSSMILFFTSYNDIEMWFSYRANGQAVRCVHE